MADLLLLRGGEQSASALRSRFMQAKTSDNRLSRIQTRWTMVVRAHRGQGDEAAAVQRRLLLVYYRAVYYYLRGMVRDGDVAEELTHEFCVRFLRGDFRRATPRHGRFRDLVKTAARNLALDYWKRQELRKRKGPRPLPPDNVLGDDTDSEIGCLDDTRHEGTPPHKAVPRYVTSPKTEVLFLRKWQESLLVHAWKGLARIQKHTGVPYFTLLRYKSLHPGTRSEVLAQQLGTRLGRPFTAAGIRQMLLRARNKLADCLVQQVARSLLWPTPAELESELLELNLFEYCKEALQRFQKGWRQGRFSSCQGFGDPRLSPSHPGSGQAGRP
jgi:DNA-directed RNA polymerase specialized sigma24 family protein